VETVEPLMKEKGHELSVAMYRSLRVRGDPARLVQCLANILTNAAKYTDPGGRIQLEVRDDGHDAHVIISDNGIGIAADLQPTVFDLFVQGDRTLDRAQGGLGIGLSVVKRLVEMHGGSASLFSAGPGQGSRFEVKLPLLQREEGTSEQPAQPQVPARRILVVDDNADAANSLAIILSLEGHQVECAYSAQDALARARSVRPDVALLDIGLPGMDGYELARQWRAHPELAGTRLVALTGYGTTDDKVRAHASGFDAHLVKPAELRALQGILAEI
jgi:CheY-like chemotaxis protein